MQAHEIDAILSKTLPSLATAAQVAAVLQTTVDGLAQDRYRRRGLPFVKIGGRVRYWRVDIATYLAAQQNGAEQ